MYSNAKFIKKVPANYDGRDFLIGDLHGCYNEFMELLKYIKFNPKYDRVFSTGDLIDRGPRSLECLQLLKQPWFFSVLGNHEEIMIDKVKQIEFSKTNTNNEESIYYKTLSKYINDVYKLPLVLEVEHLLFGKFYITHAEILPEHLAEFKDLSSKEYEMYSDMLLKNDFEEPIIRFFEKYKDKSLTPDLMKKLIWSRKNITTYYKVNKENLDKKNYSFLNNKIESKLKVFCGHNVVPFPIKIGQQYYMDTGAALGYSNKELSSYLFNAIGHSFFTLSLLDITSGICFGCVTSEKNRGKILKFKNPLYSME